MKSSTRKVLVGASLPLFLLFIQFYNASNLEIWFRGMPKEAIESAGILVGNSARRTASSMMMSASTNVTSAMVIDETENAVVNETRISSGIDVTDQNYEPLLEPTCTSRNSKKWLESVRLGNAPVENAKDMLNPEVPILSHFLPLISQTVCHRQSPFLTEDSESLTTMDDLSTWTVRLIFLSVHYHQHRHALAEAKVRQSGDCNNQLQSLSIGNFDYECPEAKFFVVGLPPHGLGSVLRKNAQNSMIAGLVENRTVLFMNNRVNGTIKTRYLYYKWISASCDRFDYQCSFQPLSPCVVTQDELDEAYVLTPSRIEFDSLFAGAEAHKEDRVVVLDLREAHKPVPDSAKQALQRISNDLIDQLDKGDPRIPMFRNASDAILRPTSLHGVEYANADSVVARGILMYNMRPNAHNLQELNKAANPIQQQDLENILTVGLPIRGSDKCWKESECLTFSQYMRVVTQLWRKTALANQYKYSQYMNILLTSDDAKVLKAQKLFTANDTLRGRLAFTPRFILNDHDVHQTKVWSKPRVNADKHLLDSLSSLKTQLNSKHTIGNCCSHFHNVLFDLLRGGCGITKDVQTECLQNNENPEFQLCCHPQQTPVCVRERDQRLAEYLAQNNQTNVS